MKTLFRADKNSLVLHFPPNENLGNPVFCWATEYGSEQITNCNLYWRIHSVSVKNSLQEPTEEEMQKKAQKGGPPYARGIVLRILRFLPSVLAFYKMIFMNKPMHAHFKTTHLLECAKNKELVYSLIDCTLYTVHCTVHMLTRPVLLLINDKTYLCACSLNPLLIWTLFCISSPDQAASLPMPADMPVQWA